MEKQDSMYNKYVNQKIEEGLEDIKNGDVYTREEARVYLHNKREDFNGWCRNCDNQKECNHINLPSCEEFMFRTDGKDSALTSFVKVEREKSP